MAVISKIRSYSGLLIAVIGIALASFVLGDFLGYGPSRSQSLEVGSVGEKKILYPDFENKVAQAMDNYRNQTGNQNPAPNEVFQIRQQVWDQMVREILLAEQFEKAGVIVHPDELTDLIIGENPHPAIIQSFTNPADGSFDSQSVVEFLQNMNSMDPSMQDQWFNLEDYIRQQRKETKYHTLIRKAFIMPDLLVNDDYLMKNTTATAKVLVKRFTDIADSLVIISDSQLRKTYNENKDRFEREESRNLEYVVFPIFPSDEDRETIRQEIENLKQPLIETDNLATFINSNSDTRFDDRFYSKGELSPVIDSLMFVADEGAVYGPYNENNAFVIAKLAEVQFRPDSMKASHILIAHQGSRSATPETVLTRELAQAKADSIVEVVRRAPASFASLATELSDDPSAISNSGDLGWFADGSMVPGFNEAVIENPVNSFTVAESEFGFHVIQITGKSNPSKKIKVALLTRNIEYSNRTFQQVYAQASAFSAALRDNSDFDAVVEEQGLSKRVVDNILPMDNAIAGIDNPRGIIQWAYAERTSEGSISQIFDLEGRFVVARLADIKSAGIPELSDIEEDIRKIAITERKAEMITEEYANASGSTLEEKAQSMGLEVRTIDNVRFSSNNLTGFGAEPAVIGSVFALEQGTISEAIEGNAGVFLIEVTQFNKPEVPENLSAQKTQLANTFRNRVPNESFRAIQEASEVDDKRHMFY